MFLTRTPRRPRIRSSCSAGRQPLASLALVLALLLSACASSSTIDASSVDTANEGSDTVADSSDAEAPDSADDTSDSSTQDDSDASDEPESIAELLGFGPNGPSQAEQEELARQAEEKVAACMIGQGFEYTPYQDQNISSFEMDETRDTRAYAEENGFGISTNADDMFGPPDPDEAPPDPNEEYLSSLSEGEVQAYYAALYGPDFDREPPLDENGEPDFEAMMAIGPQGCQAAGEEAFAQQGRMMMALMPSLIEFESTLNADSRIVAMNREWASCMGDAGFAYSEPNEMFQDVFNRLMQASGMGGTADGNMASFSVPEGQPDAAEQAEIDANMDALADFEREVAVANFDCSEDNRGRYEEIRAEYEKRFIADNRDLIDEARGN